MAGLRRAIEVAAHVWRGILAALLLLATVMVVAVPVAATRPPQRKIAEMELQLLGLTAAVEPARPAIPKDVAGGVRVVVRAGEETLSVPAAVDIFGAGFVVRGDLSGPGLSTTVAVPEPGAALPADPFVLPLPALGQAGDYTLSNLRIESQGVRVLDVTPPTVTVQVLAQVLVTSVQTRALTLDEIRAKGIVLDADDYLGFEFTLGLLVESSPVTFSFPVVFDRAGVPVPESLMPPAQPQRGAVNPPMPTIVPMLLEPEEDEGTGDGGGSPPVVVGPSGSPVRIPGVLVIPGNVGYLRQFFSAQLFVANGAPVGSGLTVRDVTATIVLPPGQTDDPGDDPLVLAETQAGPASPIHAVRGVGDDGVAGTDDDTDSFEPSEQGQAEFLLRADLEGFHHLAFKISALLEGLATGDVRLKGTARGGVLVRNPYFDMTFTVPSIVRAGEPFTMYVSVTNIGAGTANDVSVALEGVSGATLEDPEPREIETLLPGDSKTVSFEFVGGRTGKVVANYLRLDGAPGHAGRMCFTVGIGERGVPLSPDTLVLPASVAKVPPEITAAAMRVLGQAWSVANAPAGTLPAGVQRASKATVTARALALAEAGLRITLGEDEDDAIPEIAFDFWHGEGGDLGFEQLLENTEAGRALRAALGGTIPEAEPVTAGHPELRSATLVGRATLSAAGDLGQHALLVFDRILDGESVSAARYAIPGNTVVSAKAILSKRLVALTLAQPEGPYVESSITVTSVRDRSGRSGGGTAPFASLLTRPGAVVHGRVLKGDGTPVVGQSVTYLNYDDPSCASFAPLGYSAVTTDESGAFGFRYVAQDATCGQPFELRAVDPGSGALRRVVSSVRSAGEHLVLDIVLMGRGSVTGRVTDLGGRVLADASVTVQSLADFQVGGRAETDSLGAYRVDGLPVGTISVTAAKGGGVGRSTGTIGQAGGTTVVDVVVDAGSVTVSGFIMRMDGAVAKPVPGAIVVYFIRDPGSASSSPVGWARSGADGAYRIEGVPAGTYRVEARGPNGERQAMEGTSASGDDITADMTFPRPVEPETGTVTGTVRLPDGSPAERAVVSVESRGVLTDASGRYSLSGVEVKVGASRYLQARSVDGKRTAQSTFVLNEDGAEEVVNLTLSGLGHARFVVLDPSNQLVVGVPVRVLDYCANPCGCLERQTDADGAVEFENLPLGGVRAQAVRSFPTHSVAARGTASLVADGQTGVAVLRLPGSGSVEGTVTDHGDKKLLGADVSFWGMRFVDDPAAGTCGMTFTEFQNTRTDTNGFYRFQGVAEGRLQVTASQQFYPTPTSRSDAITSDGQVLTLDLQLVDRTSGILSGTVFGPDGVTAVPAGIRVTAKGVLPEITAVTKADGTYRFPHILPQGNYTLTITDPTTGAVAKEAVYLPAVQDTVLNLRLLGRGTVGVRVVGEDGVLVDSGYVRLTEMEFPNRTLEAALESANQGVAVFREVNEGRFSIVAQSSWGRGGRASGVMPVDGAAVEVRLTLAPTGTVTGHFNRGSGDPYPTDSFVSRVNGRLVGQKATEASGDVGLFEFDHVPAGSVSLEAQDPLTGRTGLAAGQLSAEGQTLVLDITAQALGAVEGTVTSNGGVQAGADVTVASGSYSARTIADGYGHYSVDGVPAGLVTVKASLGSGFLEGSATQLLEGEGSMVTVDVALRPSGAIDGTIVPAPPLATVTFSTRGATLRTLSSTDGGFRFERAPAGAGVIAVDVDGSADKGQVDVDVPSGGTATVIVPLNGTGRLTVNAFDSAGAATRGTVWLTGMGTVPWARVVAVGDSGAVSLPDLLAGSVAVTLQKVVGGVTLLGLAQAEIVRDQNATVSVRLEPTGSVVGRVLRSDGQIPAEGADVVLCLYPSRATRRIQAGSGGDFRFDDLPLGAFDLNVFDANTGGKAVVRGRLIQAGGEVVDLGIIVLDQAAPTFQVIEPAQGSTRATFAGPLVFDVSDERSGVDLSTLVVRTSSGRSYGPGAFEWQGRRATAALAQNAALAGDNSTTFEVKDVAGNTGTAGVTFVVTGGTVHGVVRRGTAPNVQAVPGATVEVGDRPPVQTNESGEYVVTGVRPGTIAVIVTDPVSALQTTLTLTLGDGEGKEQDVVLAAFGRVWGQILDPLGQRVDGAVVELGAVTVTTTSNGLFAFENLRLVHPYTIDVQLRGRLRARVPITIPADDPDLESNITLVGVGTVRGTIADSTSHTAAQGAAVTLVSKAVTYGGSRSVTASATGVYVFDDVPVGELTLSAVWSGLAGDAFGAIAAHGADVTIDVQVLSEAVALPAGFYDGNDIDWAVDAAGRMPIARFQDESPSPRLSLVRDGVTAEFTGPDASLVPSRQDKREIFLEQQGLAGLDVTRRVFVPQTGYFVRYLDLLRNPGPDPVTVDVSWLTIVSSERGTVVPTQTSSGDSLVDAGDGWVVLDDEDAIQAGTLPPTAIVLSGEGGTRPSRLVLEARPSQRAALDERWSAVTILPGHTVGLLHLLSAEEDRNRGAAAATRLAQLPPEALLGLSAEDAAAVLNFHVPADLQSVVAPLPSLDGVVNGRVLAGDGVTPVANAAVRFQSASPYYGRSRLEASDRLGRFSLEPSSHSGHVEVVPREAFALSTALRAFGVDQTATMSGSLAATSPLQADLVFRDTGVVRVAVHRADESAVASARVTLTASSVAQTLTADATGSATFVLVPSGAASLTVTHPSGNPSVLVSVAVPQNAAVLVDVPFESFGSIGGIVRTATGAGVAAAISLEGPGLTPRTVYASSPTFAYRFPDVPPGTYTVTARDTRSGALEPATVVVESGVEAQASFTMPPVGRVLVTVHAGSLDGPVVPSAWVYVLADSRHGDPLYVGVTDAEGRFEARNVPGPAVRVRIHQPNQTAIFRDSELMTIETEGQFVSTVVVVPGLGTVTGTLRGRDGTPITAGTVEAVSDDGAIVYSSMGVAAGGAFSLPNVLTGPFRLRASSSVTYNYSGFLSSAEVRGVIPEPGAKVSLDALLSAGTVSSGQPEFWALAAAVGESLSVRMVRIDLGSTQAMTDPALEIYGPDGGLVAENDNENASSKDAMIDVSAPTSGRYVVVARSASRGTGSYRLGWAGTPATLSAFEAPRVEGVVSREGDGQGLVNLRVRAVRAGRELASTNTAADGTYSLGVPAGPFELQVLGDDGSLLGQASGTTGGEGTTLTQNVTLAVQGLITVRVSTAGGVPAAAQLTLTATDFFRTATSTNGLAVFGDVLPGSYTLTAQDPRNLARVTESIDVPIGATPDALVTLRPVATVTITPTVGEEIVSGGIVSWQADSRGPEWVNVGTTDASPTFTLVNVPGPEAHVRVVWTFPSGSVATAMSGRLEVTFEGIDLHETLSASTLGSIQGTARTLDGSAVASVVVAALATSDLRQVGTATSNTAGAFSMSDVSPGRVRLRAERSLDVCGTTLQSKAEGPAGVVTAGMLLEQDALVAAGVLGPLMPIQFWEVSGTAGSAFTVSAVGTTVGAQGPLPHLDLSLYRSDGQRVSSGSAVCGPASQRATVTPSADERYLITVGADGLLVNGAYGLAVTSPSSESTLLRPYSVSVGGTIRFDSGAPMPSARVRVTNAGGSTGETRSDQQGRYTLPLLGTGRFKVSVMDASALLLREEDIDAPYDPSQPLDFVIPDRESVHVVVSRNGSPISSLAVTLKSDHANALPGDGTRQLETGSTGETAIVSLPVGTATAEVYDSKYGQFSATSQLLTLGTPLTLSIALEEVTTIVTGRAFAADGVTPLAGATVSATWGDPVATDTEGRYVLTVTGLQQTLAASFGSRTGSWAIAPNGGTLEQDLILPVDILRGRVLQPDAATPAVAAFVLACGDFYGSSRCMSMTTDGDGLYAFFDLPSWGCGTFGCEAAEVSVTARLVPEAAAHAEATFEFVESSRTTHVVNLTLPAIGRVTGHVTDAAGMEIPDATVSLQAPAGTTIGTTTAGSDGSFAFEYAPAGLVRVFAQDADGIPGDAERTVQEGQTLEIPVHLVPTTTFEITLSRDGAPLARNVDVAVLDAPVAAYPNPMVAWGRSVTTSADGPSPIRVPAGAYRVSSRGEYDSETSSYVGYAAAEGVAEPVATTGLPLTWGSHTSILEPLVGDSGSYCFVNSWGCDSAFGVTATSVSDAVRSEETGWESVVGRDLEGHGLRTPTTRARWVRTWQRHFVPASGAFARTVTFVQNPTTTAIDVTFDSVLERNGASAVLASSDGDTVFDSSDSWGLLDGETVTAVVVGPRVTSAGLVVEYYGEGYRSYLRSSTTSVLAPGATVALLTYTISRASADAAELPALADALASLTDPDALAGLTAEERAAIVNFQRPGNTTVSGIVLDAIGLPVPGALVGAIADGKVVVAATTAQDAAGLEPGRFDLTSVAPGALRLVAIDPVTHIPGRLDVEVTGDAFDAGVLTLLPESALGTVQMELHSGIVPTVGTKVELTAAEFRPFWKLSGALDANGRLTFLRVPAGSIRVSTVLGLFDRTLEPGGTLEIAVREGVGCATARGTVVDAQGSGWPGIRVGVWDESGQMLAETETDAEGAYTVKGLGAVAGAVAAQGLDPATGRRTDTVSEYVYQCSESSEEYSFSPLSFAPPEAVGSIAVTGVYESTDAPLANTQVRLHAPGVWWPSTIVLDENGHGTFTDTPAGYFSVSADVSAPNWGWAEGYAAPGMTTRLIVRVGIGLDGAFPVNLSGSDGTPYFVAMSGQTTDTAEGGCDSFCSGALVVDGTWRSYQVPTGRLLQEGREVAVGSQTASGVESTTRAFVPPDGRFMRSVQTIRNTSEQTTSVTLDLSDQARTVWTVASTSSGDAEVTAEDDHAAFTSSNSSMPEVAFVFRSPGAPAANSTSVWTAEEERWAVTTTWPDLTLAPGKMVLLVRYMIKRPHGDTADLEAQVQSLADLTDPDALAGLSAAERAAIINFNIPAELLEP